MDRYYKKVAPGSYLATGSKLETSPVIQRSSANDTRHQDSHVPLDHTSFSTQNSRIDVGTLLHTRKGDNISVVVRIQNGNTISCFKESINTILEEIGYGNFAVVVDEFLDASGKQQMSLILRYVDENGFVRDRLVGLAHVTNISAESLKDIIYAMLAQLSLTPSRIRGQGYNGASNTQGHIHALRSLILDDCSSAHYVHCFSHEIPLIIVKVAQKHFDVECSIDLVERALNAIATSYKRRDEYQQKQAKMVEEALLEGEFQTKKGLNGNIYWDFHFKTFCNFINMFSSIVNVLDALALAGDYNKSKTQSILDGIQTFEFAFMVHLMKLVLGVIYPLSLCLQPSDKNIFNAVLLVRTAKILFQDKRNEGWEYLMNDVNSFCIKHDIDIPSMDEFASLRLRGKRKRIVSDVTVEHYYRVNVFYTILDMQIQELNSRFNETCIQLLNGVGCLHPANSFYNYNKEKIIKMAQLYPGDFDELAINGLDTELDDFVSNFSGDELFSNVSTLHELSRTLVHTGLHKSYPTLYKLLKLALILPISTPSVERVYSTIKFVKSDLSKEEFLNDLAVTYSNCDLFGMDNCIN